MAVQDITRKTNLQFSCFSEPGNHLKAGQQMSLVLGIAGFQRVRVAINDHASALGNALPDDRPGQLIETARSIKAKAANPGNSFRPYRLVQSPAK